MEDENKVEEEVKEEKPKRRGGKKSNAEDIRKANKAKYLKEVVNKLPDDVLSRKILEPIYTDGGKLKGTPVETTYKLVVNGKCTDKPGNVKRHLMKGRKINAV